MDVKTYHEQFEAANRAKSIPERRLATSNNPLQRRGRSWTELCLWIQNQVSLLPLALISQVCSFIQTHRLACTSSPKWPSTEFRHLLKPQAQPAFGLSTSPILFATIKAIRFRPQHSKHHLWFQPARDPCSDNDFLSSLTPAQQHILTSQLRLRDPVAFFVEIQDHSFVFRPNDAPLCHLIAPPQPAYFPEELCCHLDNIPGWIPCTLWPVGYDPADVELPWAAPCETDLIPLRQTKGPGSLIPLSMNLAKPIRKKQPPLVDLRFRLVLGSKTCYINLQLPLPNMQQALNNLCHQLQAWIQLTAPLAFLSLHAPEPPLILHCFPSTQTIVLQLPKTSTQPEISCIFSIQKALLNDDSTFATILHPDPVANPCSQNQQEIIHRIAFAHFQELNLIEQARLLC